MAKAIGRPVKEQTQIPFGVDKQKRGDDKQPTGERLQKILAAAGVASRRKAEEIILAGGCR